MVGLKRWNLVGNGNILLQVIRHVCIEGECIVNV